MLRRFRPSVAGVLAFVALCVALGGTSFAALNLPKNSVGAKELKKNAVTAGDIKANAVTGAKVKNDSLTGADIKESTLAKVPSAGTADAATTAQRAATADSASAAANADKLGGKPASEYLPAATLRRFGSRLTKGDATKDLATNGTFTLQAKCEDNGGDSRIEVFLATTEANSIAHVSNIPAGSEVASDLDPSDAEAARLLRNESQPDLFFGGGVPFEALAPSGQHVEGQFTLGFNVAGVDCQVSGYLIG